MKCNLMRSKWVVAIVAGWLTAGCTPPPPPPPPPPAPVVWQAPASRAECTAQLEPLADQFTDQVATLPGSNASEHRKIVMASLDKLILILQLSNGRDESPAFANRIAVVTAARKTLSDETIPRSRMEAAENQALVATIDALDEISTRFLFDDDKLPALDQAGKTAVSAALKSQGPMHDLDASNGLTSIQTIVRQQTDDLIARFGTADARARLASRTGLPMQEAPTGPTTKLTNDPAP